MSQRETTMTIEARKATHGELERRVDAVAHELAAGLRDERDNRPQWIDPAELVRRVRPFLSDN